MKLRPYQREAVDAVMAAWLGGVTRPALSLATGLGKTVIFVELARMGHGAQRRVVILVHRDELVRQTVDKLAEIAPSIRVGVIQGRRMEISADVCVASVQTLVRRLHRIDMNRFNLIITDECHHSPSASYQKIYAHFGVGKTDSGCLSLGVSATMARTDKIGLGADWQSVVFNRDIAFGIKNGYLAPVRAATVVIPALQLDEVRTSHGDLSDSGLAEAMSSSQAGPLIADAYLEHACHDDGTPRRGIMFAPTVETAQIFAQDFIDRGIPTEVITGKTPTEERQGIFARVRTGETRVIASVFVLTEGFDLPAVEVAVMARPTKSAPLYIQCVGRIMRPSHATGKLDALILDVVGTTTRHRLASVIDLSLPKDEPHVRPSAYCPCEEGCHCPDSDCLDCTGGCFTWCICRPVETEELDEAPPPEQISMVEIDPFTGEYIVRHPDTGEVLIRRPGPPPPKPKDAKRTPWLKTHGGIPFLPSTQLFEFTIFLWAEQDGSWTVGEQPRRGKAKILAKSLPFREAVAEALDSHPYGDRPPRKLEGSASQAQLNLLANFGIEAGAFGMTKQAASDAIAIEKASRVLD